MGSRAAFSKRGQSKKLNFERMLSKINFFHIALWSRGKSGNQAAGAGSHIDRSYRILAKKSHGFSSFCEFLLRSVDFLHSRRHFGPKNRLECYLSASIAKSFDAKSKKPCQRT